MRLSCKNILLVVAASFCLWITGCENQFDADPADDVGTLPSIKPTAGLKEDPVKKATADAIARPAREMFLMQIRIAVVQIPAGQRRKLEKLWSYMDEEQLSLKSTVMGLNGLRVGVGKKNDWIDVERILKKLAGENFEAMTFQAPPGKPQAVEIKLAQPIQSIFVYSADQTLRGMHYQPGDNIMTISASPDRDDNSKLIMTVLPQVRTTKRFTSFVKEGGITKMVQKPKFIPFRELEFQLNIPSEDFIIIGPGSQASRKTSLAHHFLKETLDGVMFDKLLIFSPKVYKVKLTNNEF